MWSNAGGTGKLVVRGGFDAPGCLVGTKFLDFPEIGLPDQGGVVMLANLQTGTGDAVSTNNQGI